MTFPEYRKFSALFGLWTLHGGIALLQFVSLPSDGFSLQRVLMLGALTTWIVLNLILVFSILRKVQWLSNLLKTIKRPNIKDGFFTAATFIVIVRIWIALVSGLLAAGGNFKYGAYIERLDPLLNLAFFVALESVALIVFFTFQNKEVQRDNIRSFIKRIIAILSVLGLVSLQVYFTGSGVVPGYKGDWARGIPAVALMEWHIVLACLFCVGMIALELKYDARKNLDTWICVALWFAAAGLWLSQPVIPSSSALAPREPNFEIYPFNDAQVYDGYAQSAMIGAGYGVNTIPQRPLYIVGLIAMHALAGQNYDNVIVLQSLLLAFFPVLLYLFGKEFVGRPVGIAIALLAILRDIMSNIAAPFTGNLSYTKLYLSEIPTAMMLILFLLVGMPWIKRGFPLFLGFMMGGVLGIGILIRTQVVIAFPVLILFALLSRPRLFSPALKSAALGVFAIAILVFPWLARNWNMTGQLLFDNPASQTANLALRYSRVNGLDVDITQLPGESNSDYNRRMLIIANEALGQDPFAIGREITSSFINHGINNILLFPLRYDLESFDEIRSPTKAFWQEWHSDLNLSQTLLLGFYIFLFGLGLAFAWQRLGWLGFLPLGVNLAYNLWTSIALLSGQRFMLTMDWSAYTYYVIGLFALLSAFLFMLERKRELIRGWYVQNQFAFIEFTDNANWRDYVFTGVFFFVIGASLWGVEMMFPQRYPTMAQGEVINEIVSSPAFVDSKLDAACFQKVVFENELEIMQGRALYPRYYQAGDGETFTDAFGYKKSNEDRIVFEMVGQMGGRVVFPTLEYTEFFPNAADVTLGVDRVRNPWFVLVEQENTRRFYFSDFFDSSVCD